MADTVELCFPARAELLALARLTVATLGARAGFDYEEIEDLRLALDELCAPLASMDQTSARLHVVFSWAPRTIEVHCRVDGPAPEPAAPFDDELSDRLLDALVDEHGRASGDGGTSWLRKRRSVGDDP